MTDDGAHEVMFTPMRDDELHWCCSAYWDTPVSSCEQQATVWVEVGNGFGRSTVCASERCVARVIESYQELYADREATS